nr:hypothetical protein RTCK_02927 [Rhizobium sp. TCK]
MRNGRLAAALGIVVPLSASAITATASAQALCTKEFLQLADAIQPAAIVVKADETVTESIERNYGCSFQFFESGTVVYSDDGEALGAVKAFGTAEDGKDVVAYLDVAGFLGIGEKPIAVPLNDFSTFNNAGIVARLSAEAVRELPTTDWKMSEGTVFASESGEKMLTGLARAKLSASQFFLPPQRDHVIFGSDPAPADIYMGDAAIDKTEVQLIIRRNVLTKIELRKAGYRSCPFGHGRFEEGDRERPAHFFCTLEQAE